MDRYFCAPGIADKLHKKKINVVGTCRKDRKELPKDLKQKKLKKGEHVSFRSGPVLAVKWKDTRDVIMCTTIHKDNMVAAGARGEHQKVKPQFVVDYNNFKCGVDKHDQLLSYYSFQRLSIKWWKKLFFHLIDISVVCTNVLFNISRENNKDHLKINRVYELLAESLAKEATGEELAIQCNQPLIQNERVIPTKHFPRPNNPKPGSKRRRVPSRQCVVCKAKYTR